MTLGDWLATRTPLPPPALAARLAEVLRGDLDAREDEIPERCLTAAARLLESLIEPGSVDAMSRDVALDLLTADALVTYAFEHAADDPGQLDAMATTAMRRIAALVPGESPA